MIRRLWPILFLVLLPLLFQAQTPTRGVSAGEYFWDTDPGLGNGTAFFTTDGTFDETVEALLATGITVPSGNGPHLFSVRIQDVDGQWGTLFTTVVEQFSLTTTHRNLAVASAEFFWDTDPGQGNGTALLALDGNLNEAVEALFENGITVPSSAGAHLFNVRVQDIEGGWSQVFTTTLYYDPSGSTLRNPEVIQAEYYWDADPGPGLGDPILAFDGALDEAVEALLNTGVTAPAGVGPHTFSLRVLDADYQWSTVFTTTVYRDTLTQAVRPLHIAMAEYYWDVDPGVGLANPILAADGAFDEAVEALLQNGIIMPSINGPHTFNLRVKDNSGVWSQTFTTTLHRDSIASGTRPTRVVAGEYFWDVDPGQGLANPMVALDGNFNETVEAMLDAAVILPSINGAHTFNVRAKGSDGAWGPLFTTQVYRDSVTTQTRQVRVAAGEYFWNADPGPGAGTPISATDGTFDEILEGLENNAISITGLPAGANLLSIRAQDSNGDWGPVFSMVVVTSSPTFRQDTILGQVAFCGDVPATSVTYFADTVGGNTYTWTAQNGTIVSGQGGDSVQVLWNSTGPWSIMVEGCNPQFLCDTLFLTIDTLPLPAVNAGLDMAICPGGNTSLLATTTTPPVTFAWTPSTGLSNTTIANPVANPSVTTLYTVTVTDTNGCQQSDDVQVTVNPPATAFAGNDTLICRGSSAQLNATGGVSYAWSPGTGLSSTTIANPLATPLTTTTYTVTVTDINGCTASDAVVVTVSNGPNVDAGANAAICIGDTAQLNATGAITYAWSPGATLTATNIQNPRAFPLVTTKYYVTGTDVYGCLRTDSMTLTVNPLPTVNASADVARCLGQSVTISATGATSYVWTPSAGLSNPNIASPLATPTVTTLYTVLGTNANGCKDTANVQVTINPLPLVNAGADDTICAGDTLQLLATGAITYTWTPSTGLSATNIANPTAVPPFSINYTVTGTDGNGCVAIDQIALTVEVCISNTIARNILQAEYFWDTDPGQGSATPIAAADGTFDETVEALLESAVNMPATPGAHSFNIRVMDRQNNWGPLFTTLVFRDTLTPSNRTIGVQMAEYYWDADPGQGNGTPMIAFDGSYGESVEAVLAPTANVPTNGTHLFSVRIQDSEGTWSTPFSTVIRYDSVVVPTRTVAVQMAEYFWDTDPGPGLGIPMLALDGNLDEAVEALLESGATVPAGYGAHSFGVRVRDDQTGGWSSVFTTMVFRDSIEVTHRDFKVVQAEYFWDVDPGQGSGLPMLALDGNLDEAVEALLNNPVTVPGAYGAHKLGIRVKDVGGSWGSVFSMMVVRDTIQTTTRPVRISQAEYFWDTDPGQGNGTPLLATDGAIDEIVESFLNNPVNVPAVVGPHIFHVRVRDVNNNWGPLFRTVVHHDSVTVGTRTLMVSQAEYFWDADPGQGNGTPMLAFDGNLDEMVESVFATGIQVPLPYGAHRFRVRVKDFNGVWSSVFTMMVDRDTITPIARDIHLTQAEYFWNTDPGQGNGTAMLALDGAIDETVEKLTRSINVQSLLPGPNVLGVRVKDFNGVWSNPFRIVLVIDSVLVTVPEEVVGNLHFCEEISATPEGYSIDTVGTQTYTWFVTGGNLLNGQGGDSITVQWNPTGPYMLKVLVCGNGICDTTYQQILVTPNPTIVATPDTAYICAGQAVQLVATGGVAFIWTPSTGLNDDDIPNPFASPIVPTQYIVRGTDNFGCHGFDTVFVDINSGGTVNAGPDTTICLGDSVQLNVSGGGISYAWSPSAGLSDPNISNPVASPSVTTTYTVLVQTGGSCPATDQVTVYVDNLPPTITCPASITVSNDPAICGAFVAWTAPIGTDNCSGATTTQYAGPASGNLFVIGTTLIGYEATDGQGLRDSCQFTVTVNDNEAPVLVCPGNITVNNNPGTCAATVTYAIPAATDNCPGFTVSQTAGLGSGASFPVGTTSEAYLATDASGNVASCAFTVTVLDTEPPLVSCPSNITVSNDPGQCSANVSYSAPTVTDNCSAPAVVQIAGLGAGASFPVGTTWEVYTASDISGNSDTCSFTITVNDAEAPTISGCPSAIIVPTDPGVCTAVVSWTAPTISDNCPGLSVSNNFPSGSTFPQGTTTVSYLATDNSGNADSCVFTVTVISPEINITGNALTIIDGDLTPAILDGTDFGTPLPGVPVVHTFTIENNGTIPLNISNFSLAGAGAANFTIGGISLPTVIAAGGNTTFTVTFLASATGVYNATLIVDNDDCDEGSYDFAVRGEVTCIPAVFTTCPNNVVASTDSNQCNAVVNYNAVVSASPAATVTYAFSGATTGAGTGNGSGSIFGLGMTTVELIATNACGADTCSFTVTVNDSASPAITCPGNAVVSTDSNSCSAIFTYPMPTATDNCSGATISLQAGLGSGAIFPLGTTTETYLATDMGGNTVSCSFNITINDSIPPTIVCPANISVNNDTGLCSAVVNYPAPIIADNCPGATVALIAGQASGTAFPVGFTFTGYEATDASGNSSTCYFNVSVNDNEAPTMTDCPTNLVVNADPNLCGAAVSWYGPNFTDNCAGIGISYTDAPGDTFGLGVHNVIYFAIDNNFLTNYCMFSITVVDSIVPEIICPTPISVANDPGNCGAVVNYSQPASTDNCTGYTTTLLSGLGVGGTFPIGTSTEIWVVNDLAGNSDTCNFTVTIIDQEAPSITCPANLVVPTALGECKENVFYTAPIGTDNCPGATTVMLSGQGIGGTFFTGTNTEVYSVTDQAGLTDTCSFTITVEDQELPLVACPGNISVIKDPGQSFAVVNFAAPAASDNCPGVTMVQSQGLASGSQFPIGLTLNVFVATDAAGNVDSCSFLVQVVDSSDVVPPSITCPANIVLNNDPGICGAVVNFAPPVGTDNLPGPVTVQTTGLGSSSTFPVGVTIQTFVVTDVAGNQDSCTFTVTVLDNELPTAICQPIIIYLDSTGNYNLNGSEMSNGSSDNCGVTFSVSQSQFDCNDLASSVPTDLFISEYIDGTGQNQCIEIFNGTGFPVDLGASGYTLRIYYNGATAYSEFPLNGVVADGDVFVFCKNNAASQLVAQADQVTNLALWTGDDAIALTKSGQMLDIFGRIGEDPGSGWSDNGKVTVNHTLLRKNTVLTGVSTNPGVGFATLDAEWEVFPVNYSSDLGTHSFVPPPPTYVTLTVSDPSGNSAQCQATYIVRDTLAPELSCQPVTVMLDAYGQASLTPQMVSPALSDNCTLDSAFLDISQFDCSNVGGGGTLAMDLFFSEYVEGSANTKCIEIFNGTGAPIDLSAGNYAIRIYFNGATTYTEHLLSGVVANGDVFVFCHRNADNLALAQADLISQTQLWTGDDAIELVHNGTTLDIFGRIGEDPGSAWSLYGKLTINQTLIRIPSVKEGISVNPSVGFPTLATEWTSLPIDDLSDLGMHYFLPPPTGNSVLLTAVDNSGNISSCTANVTVLANCQPRFDTCQADIVATCPLSNGISTVVTWNAPVAEVNCSALCSLSVVQIAGPPSGSIFLAGTTTTIVYVATSGSHTDTCSFDVIVPICPPLREAIGDGAGIGEAGQAALTPIENPMEKPVTVFPNPFRETVTFRFIVEQPAEVELVITDLNGRILRRFLTGHMDAGVQHWIWDATEDSGTPVTSGIYLYRLRMGDRVEFGKVEYVR